MEIKAGTTERHKHAASERESGRFVCGDRRQDRGLLWHKIKDEGRRLSGSFCARHAKTSFESGDDCNYSHVTSLEVGDNRTLEASNAAADCKQRAKHVVVFTAAAAAALQSFCSRRSSNWSNFAFFLQNSGLFQGEINPFRLKPLHR